MSLERKKKTESKPKFELPTAAKVALKLVAARGFQNLPETEVGDTIQDWLFIEVVAFRTGIPIDTMKEVWDSLPSDHAKKIIKFEPRLGFPTEDYLYLLSPEATEAIIKLLSNFTSGEKNDNT